MFIPDQQEDMWLKCYKNMVQYFLSCKHGLQYNRTTSIYINLEGNIYYIYIKLWGITTEFVAFIPQSLVLRSIVLGWILLC